MEVFAAMIDLVDQNIGRLINELQTRDVFDNTLFLFCADNGGCPFERTRGRNLKPWDPNSYWTYDASWAQASNTPFRLYKQNQHEGGISSPLIVHWPNGLKTEAGSITRQPAHLIDFMATFLDLGQAIYPEEVGVRTIDPLEGRSLVPIFKGKQRKGHETLYFHYGSDRALRKGKWKLVSAKGGKWELYDLEGDRTELKDLSVKFPKRVSAMANEWFNIAQNKERLKQKGLTPVKEELKQISFRKDTSEQLKE
jgi:arylsulfatase